MPSKKHDDFLVALGVPQDLLDQRDQGFEDEEIALEEPEESEVSEQDEESDLVEPEQSFDDEVAEADDSDETTEDEEPEAVEQDEDEAVDSDDAEESEDDDSDGDEVEEEDSDDDSGDDALGLGVSVLNDLANLGKGKKTGGVDAPTGLTLTMDEPIGVVELFSLSQTDADGREFQLTFQTSAKDALFSAAVASGKRIASAKLKTPSRTMTLKDVFITSVSSDGSTTTMVLVSGTAPKPTPQVISTLTLDEPMGVFDLVSSSQTDLAGREFAATIKTSAKDPLIFAALATGARISSAKIVSPSRNVTLKDVLITSLTSKGSTTDITLVSGTPPKPKPNRPTSSTLTMDEPIGVLPLHSFFANDSAGKSITVLTLTSEKDVLLMEPLASGRHLKQAILATPEKTVIFKDVIIVTLQSSGSTTTMSFLAASRANADP